MTGGVGGKIKIDACSFCNYLKGIGKWKVVSGAAELTGDAGGEIDEFFFII